MKTDIVSSLCTTARDRARGNTDTVFLGSYILVQTLSRSFTFPYSRVPFGYHLDRLLDQFTQDSCRPSQIGRLIFPEFKSPEHHLELSPYFKPLSISIRTGSRVADKQLGMVANKFLKISRYEASVTAPD